MRLGRKLALGFVTMSLIALIVRVPLSVFSGLREISTGNSVPTRRRA